MDAALSNLLAAGSRTGVELREGLGISQPTLSRVLRGSRDEIAVLGRGRNTRYGLYRRIRELPPELPVFRVSQRGDIERIASLVTIAPDRFWFEDHHQSAASREFASLPWFMTDMRPQGFLGRLFPQRYEDLMLPARIVDWNEDHALYAIARRGEDLAGNLLVGEESHARWLASTHDTGIIAPGDRHVRYPQLVRDAIEGRIAASSAAGEQPKFTAIVGESVASARHVLVKFTPSLDTASGRRWADLLIGEEIAASVLRAHGIRAATSTCSIHGDRAFLEVERFDRIGLRGRLGIISLGALDDEFVGERIGWAQSAAALLRARLIEAGDARTLRWLSAFGAMIANTDMHLGNASFLHAGSVRFELAPAYDMLPMFYAPVGNEVPARRFVLPAPTPATADQWRAALPAARSFWQAIADDGRVSADFRATAGGHAA